LHIPLFSIARKGDLKMDFNKFIESLEDKATKSLFEDGADAFASISGKQGWYYVPKKEFLNGLLKVAVHEVAPDKWEILYCAPGSKESAKSATAGKKLMAQSKENDIQKYQRMLSEEVEGAPDTLKGWVVKEDATWTGNFEGCLKKCVGLVQGEAGAVPSQFKKA
jgi:hypothetical protein